MKLVTIPANPVPDNVVAGSIKTPDGVNLRYARWAPPPGRKGTVVVLQGRAEFIEKYFETVRDLRARGFAVATFDWRGQGLSDRALKDRYKGHVRNFAQYEIDLDAIMAQVVLPDCPPPYYCLAHSMGGAVAVRACQAGSRWFDRAVLSAPMIALPPGRFTGMAGPFARLMRFLGRGGAYIPGGGPGVIGSEDFLGNVLTSDPVRFARNHAVLEEDPQLGLGSPTIAGPTRRCARCAPSPSPAMPAISASRCCWWRRGATTSCRRRRSRRSAPIFWPGGILFWPARATSCCRSRISIARNSGRRSTPSCRERRGIERGALHPLPPGEGEACVARVRAFSRCLISDC